MFDILVMIVNAVASLFAGVLLLRFWMQTVRIRPPMQVAQFIYAMSDWLVKPLRRIVPGFAGFDWASLIGAILVALLLGTIVVGLGGVLFWNQIVIIAIISLLQWIIYGLMGMILLGAVFSWVNPHAPMAPFIYALSAPVLRPLRRIIPLVGNLDLSPLVALLILQILLYKGVPAIAILLQRVL